MHPFLLISRTHVRFQRAKNLISLIYATIPLLCQVSLGKESQEGTKK